MTRGVRWAQLIYVNQRKKKYLLYTLILPVMVVFSAYAQNGISTVHCAQVKLTKVNCICQGRRVGFA